MTLRWNLLCRTTSAGKASCGEQAAFLCNLRRILPCLTTQEARQAHLMRHEVLPLLVHCNLQRLKAALPRPWKLSSDAPGLPFSCSHPHASQINYRRLRHCALAHRGSLGDPQGRTRAHLRSARGAVRTERHRGGAARRRRRARGCPRWSSSGCSAIHGTGASTTRAMPNPLSSRAATATATGFATTGPTPPSWRRRSDCSRTSRGRDPVAAAQPAHAEAVRPRRETGTPRRRAGARAGPGARCAAGLRRGMRRCVNHGQ